MIRPILSFISAAFIFSSGFAREVSISSEQISRPNFSEAVKLQEKEKEKEKAGKREEELNKKDRKVEKDSKDDEKSKKKDEELPYYIKKDIFAGDVAINFTILQIDEKDPSKLTIRREDTSRSYDATINCDGPGKHMIELGHDGNDIILSTFKDKETCQRLIIKLKKERLKKYIYVFSNNKQGKVEVAYSTANGIVKGALERMAKASDAISKVNSIVSQFGENHEGLDMKAAVNMNRLAGDIFVDAAKDFIQHVPGQIESSDSHKFEKLRSGYFKYYRKNQSSK